MKKQFKWLIKQIKILNYYLNPSVFASSIAFYIIVTIIPILKILNNALFHLELITKVVNLPNSFLANLFIIMSLIWSSSKLVNNLLLISYKVYSYNQFFSKIKIRIKSIIFTIILLIIIILMICIILYFSYLQTVIDHLIYLEMIQYLLIFLFVVSLLSIIYKYIIPLNISFKDIFKASSVITIIYFLTTILYQNILFDIFVKKYLNIYGSFASLILTFIWLYYNSYLFIIGMMILFYEKMYNKISIYI